MKLQIGFISKLLLYATIKSREKYKHPVVLESDFSTKYTSFIYFSLKNQKILLHFQVGFTLESSIP